MIREKQFFLGSMEFLISNARSHDAKCLLSGLWIEKLEMPMSKSTNGHSSARMKGAMLAASGFHLNQL
jgi:hypothetical protein